MPSQRVEYALRLMHQLAGIVGFAHRVVPKAIIHRDLKPANVLVQATAQGTFTPKVADFGIGGVSARHAVASMMQRGSRGAFLTTALRGSYTPIYAAPEQRRGDDPDPRDDVFSLGVIWLHLLTCDMTLEAGSDWRDEVAEMKLQEGMLDLLGRCLAQRAARRPADGAVLEAELGQLLGGKPPVKVAPVVVAPPVKSLLPVVPAPRPPVDDPAAKLIASLQGFDVAHQRAREAVKRYDFAEAVRLLEGVPADQRNHAEYAHACQGRDRRAFLEPAIEEATRQHNLFKLRFLLEEALFWMPQRADLVRLRDVVYPRTKEVSNSIGMRFVLIPSGKFSMGSPNNEAGRNAKNEPLHEVAISKPLYLGVFQVTQEEYEKVMGNNPSNFKAASGLDTRRFPVESVTWNEASTFCQRLSALPGEKQSGRVYRLPTEAEWEYSCRGGVPSRTVYPFGNAITDKQANFNQHLKRTCPVGSYPANAFGLHDMEGNVWEWCSDWYGENYYQQSPQSDPQGPSSGEIRVLRGGSWDCGAASCRSAFRGYGGPGGRGSSCGFRVVLLFA